MIEIEIPGFKKLQLANLVLDYNGTVAVDGVLIDGVDFALDQLASEIDIHIVTADTFGGVREELSDLSCKITVLSPGAQAQAKLDYVKQLGAGQTCSIGNGRNDRFMLKESALGICTVLEEGASVETLMAADVVCRNIVDALDLLLNPLRLTATLRS